MISSIAEYQAIINDIINNWGIDRTTLNPWFRGQSDTNWSLIPKIYRSQYSTEYNFERELVRDFQLYSPQYISQPPKDTFEWLFLMQHYGIATRLLDWTESSLVALYFAVDDFNYNNDSSVWIMNPWSLNSDTQGMESVLIYTHNLCEDYLLDIENFEREVKAKYPIAIRPKKNSSRITAQKGMFTVHGKLATPINLLKDIFSSLQIDKIEIKKENKLQIKKELYFSGITHSVLFPEIDGISKELTFRYSNDFMER